MLKRYPHLSLCSYSYSELQMNTCFLRMTSLVYFKQMKWHMRIPYGTYGFVRIKKFSPCDYDGSVPLKEILL